MFKGPSYRVKIKEVDENKNVYVRGNLFNRKPFNFT